jgi:hypothetical protein
VGEQPGEQRGVDAALVGLGASSPTVMPSRRAVLRSWP